MQRERPHDRVMKKWRRLDQWTSLVFKYSQAVGLLSRHDDFLIGENYVDHLPDAGYTRDVDGEQPFWQSGTRKA